jgi:5,6-dimethylbenzimidazole synthase
MPAGAEPVAVICLGPVDRFYPAPMLALQGWVQPRPLEELLFEDRWERSP